MNNIKTPCIGICSTTSLGDQICRGCKRYSFEVINWNSYTDEQKLAVLSRIERLNTQIIENKLLIVSTEKLQAGLRHWNIPYDDSLSPYCWLHNLLKKCSQQMESLQPYGVHTASQYSHLSLQAIAEIIDREILLLGEAHYARYIDTTNKIGRVQV